MSTLRRLVTAITMSAAVLACLVHPSLPAREATPDPTQIKTLAMSYTRDIQPLLARYCHDCHSGELAEAELDLNSFKTLDDVRRHAKPWVKVRELLESGQMPPPDAKQPTDDELKKLAGWVRDVLSMEASAHAGDPGPVVLRRLSNAEYTYTMRDLTGVPSLDPAREFPIDGAAGEGFTNVGQSLVMSPALVQKYLDAGKDVATHAVLLPDGIRFSPFKTRRDWTNAKLQQIRDFYARHSASRGASAVNLQGIRFDTNQGGRLPTEQYLAALLDARDEITADSVTPEKVALEHGLSPKYLRMLWEALANSDSVLLKDICQRWKAATPADADKLADLIGGWQNTLWKFNTVGYIGLESGPKQWQEPNVPLTSRHDLKFKISTTENADEVVIYLAATPAGDGSEQDFAIWERPRFVAADRPDLLLKDIPHAAEMLINQRERLFADTVGSLAAAAEITDLEQLPDITKLAEKHGVQVASLQAWLGCLGIAGGRDAVIGSRIERKADSGAGYDFIKSWFGADALSIVANSSNQEVLIPGTMLPHSVAVHPTPSKSVVIGWKSPAQETLQLSGLVQDAHTACGNGVTWSVELRRGLARRQLAAGITDGSKVAEIGPHKDLVVRKGDVIALVINPRDASHVCDLTRIDLTFKGSEKTWNLTDDVSPDLLSGNPHADAHGNSNVWHFCWEPAVESTATPTIPAGSLLAKWQTATEKERPILARSLQQLLLQPSGDFPKDAPDAVLYRQLISLQGPLLSSALRALSTNGRKDDVRPSVTSKFGLDRAMFGKHPNGSAIDADSLCVQPPSILELRLPAALIEGTEFVVQGSLHGETGREGSVQFRVLATRPEDDGIVADAPVVVLDGSAKRKAYEAAFSDFRHLFPSALCYSKIVPVDEVVTLNLFYREDDQLQRLMLNAGDIAELNRLWAELLFVAREPIESIVAFEQLVEFATQDNAALVKKLEPHRAQVLAKADDFRAQMKSAEPAHVDAVTELAGLAFRSPLSESEIDELRNLYDTLRNEELPHDDAIRLMLARIFVSPKFLYKMESPGARDASQPVSDWELATRLSYFLWSSMPDAELREVAASGKLHEDDVLTAQTRRMLADPKARRLATEFACRWLHIHGFDQLDEKSERHFPTFAGIRNAMYEESILFLTDLFQHDRRLLNILDADYTFLDESLAKHYEIPGVSGPEWRRVDGMHQYHRGGILTQASILSRQSGASRTSPILRGNWLSETILGERLPRPPKNVPQLADAPPEGLTERQLIELHSKQASCAKCHARIDPFGFALENYDAIGRFRKTDPSGLDIDTRTKLPDGRDLTGVDDLRNYLLTTRRDAIVRQFQKKLLGYALGRSVQLSDEPLLTEMQQLLEDPECGTRAIVEAIVLSPQFRRIRGRDAKFDD